MRLSCIHDFLAAVVRHTFHIRGSVPPMTSMDFDAGRNAGLVNFKNDTCQIIVISHRCHGDDLGGAKCD